MVVDTNKSLHIGALALVVVGALNWGFVGLFQLNLVEALLGTWPIVVTVVYVLVGASAVYLVATHLGDCKACGEAKKSLKKA